MAKSNPVELIQRERIVGIIRLGDLTGAVGLAEALLAAGLTVQEFTLTNPGAIDAIATVRREVARFEDGSAAIGVGSVRSVDDASRAIDAGAQYVVTPTLNLPVIDFCVARSIAVLSGALTPTEVLAAWEAGSAIVKVFPARSLGPSYIRDLLAPLPDLRLMPTGGVALTNIADYLNAGACAVGVGGSLLDESAVARQDWTRVTDTCAQFVRMTQTDERQKNEV